MKSRFERKLPCLQIRPKRARNGHLSIRESVEMAPVPGEGSSRRVPLESIPVKIGMTKGDVAETFGLQEENKRNAILIDLYFNCLAFADEKSFTSEKTATFLAIVKTTHQRAIDEMMTVERSFAFFRTLVLQNSVQRPPYSLGIYNFKEMSEITEYMLGSYYRHYKLYQYAFTHLVKLDIEHCSPVVEIAPEITPLAEADTEQAWQAKQDEIARQAAEAQQKAEEERLAAEEAEREARLKAEYEAAIPEEVTAKVQEALAAQMAEMKESLETKFKEQEEGLLAKITDLESKVG